MTSPAPKEREPDPEPTLTVVPIEASPGLSEAAVSWFMERGISEDTLKETPVWSAPYSGNPDAIHFGYLQAGQVYACKIRKVTEKKFSQQGACATWWLGEQVNPDEDLLIVEGEMDALSAREVGFHSVISVPNGAPVKVSDNRISPEDDRKFGYVWLGKELYKNAKRIIIATDNDPPGIALAEELARRIGKAKCWQIQYPAGCKDANDVLMKLGAQALKDLIDNPTPWPIAGVYDANHYRSDVKSLFTGGLGKGESTGMGPDVDALYSVVPGHLCIITGYPGAGKSVWSNQLMVNIAKSLGWRFAIQSTENQPSVLIAMLASLYLEKTFFHGNAERMSEPELDAAIDWVNDHFTILHTDEAADLAGTLDRLQTAVLRFGIRGFCVDPASYLRLGSDDIEQTGHMLEAFKCFAVSHGCVAWLIAHPKKPQNADGKVPVPGGYAISGSAHWHNRCDFGLTLHRPMEDRSVTEFHTWKVKFAWTGREGKSELFHDAPTGRFSDQPFPMPTTFSMWNGAPWTDAKPDPWEMN